MRQAGGISWLTGPMPKTTPWTPGTSRWRTKARKIAGLMRDFLSRVLVQ
jgi:hypothetical protein